MALLKRGKGNGIGLFYGSFPGTVPRPFFQLFYRKRKIGKLLDKKFVNECENQNIMELIQAQKIIHEYSKPLEKVNPANIFMSKTELPCSDAMIKYAFYTYVDELVRMHKMNGPTAKSLIVAYAHLSFFVEKDQVAALNKIASREYEDCDDADALDLLEKNKTTINLLSLKKENMVKELTEYIRDCIRVVQN
jgi:hypothetical protein